VSDFDLFLFGVCAVWGAAAAIKAIASLQSGKPYTFAVWDGGLLRAGKVLTPRGTRIRVAACTLMTASCLGLATGVFKILYVAPVLICAAVVSIISDLTNTAK